MARTARKQPTNVIPIARQPAAPVRAPETRGYAVRRAEADIGSWIGLAISTCSPWEDDPVVDIEIDRRRGSVVGEANRDYRDFIERLRASDLDSLVESLQAAIAVGRKHGVIPPSTDLPAWKQTHAKMDARDAKRGEGR